MGLSICVCTNKQENNKHLTTIAGQVTTRGCPVWGAGQEVWVENKHWRTPQPHMPQTWWSPELILCGQGIKMLSHDRENLATHSLKACQNTGSAGVIGCGTAWNYRLSETADLSLSFFRRRSQWNDWFQWVSIDNFDSNCWYCTAMSDTSLMNEDFNKANDGVTL